MREKRVWGYARVSTPKQNIGRQLKTIQSSYPGAIIMSEAYTGTKIERPVWTKLKRQLKEGDTVVFDELSRMSRSAEEGFREYKELYEHGVELVFLKESTLNSVNFRQVSQIAMTGSDVDLILEAVNKYLMLLAENQVKSAFESAQKEVDYLHKRTSEGIRRAQAEGKLIGLSKGRKLVTKKSVESKKKILKYSIFFEGSLKDTEVIQLLGLSRNTFYKYKKELIEERENSLNNC